MPLKPSVGQRGNLTIKMRNDIDGGQNFNKEGVSKENIGDSNKMYQEIKNRYGNYYSRYNIISNL